MRTHLLALTTGSTATGCSTILSAEHTDRKTDSLASRVLISVGDCTQRYCMDHRVKLSKVRCVIVPSLAPHHVSGLSGVILACSTLGVASLRIFGPMGIQGMINVMTPFCSRRYPELIINEFSSMSDVGKSTQKDESGWLLFNAADPYFDIAIAPICAADGSSTQYKEAPVLALASKVTLKAVHMEKSSKSAEEYVFMPAIGSSFSIHPSLAQLSTAARGQIRRFRISVHCQFATLGAMLGRNTPQADDDSDDDSDDDADQSVGFPRDGSIELGKPQESLAVLHSVCPAFFPRASQALYEGIRGEIEEAVQSKEDNFSHSDSDAEAEEEEKENNAS